MMTLFGAARYQRATRQIEIGSYEPAAATIVIVALIIGVLGIMAIPLVLVLR